MENSNPPSNHQRTPNQQDSPHANTPDQTFHTKVTFCIKIQTGQDSCASSQRNIYIYIYIYIYKYIYIYIYIYIHAQTHTHIYIYLKAPFQRTLTSPTPHSLTCNPTQSQKPFGLEHSILDGCHAAQACHIAPHLQTEFSCFPHPMHKSKNPEWFGTPRGGVASSQTKRLDDHQWPAWWLQGKLSHGPHM